MKVSKKGAWNESNVANVHRPVSTILPVRNEGGFYHFMTAWDGYCIWVWKTTYGCAYK